jgi:hypothetical protein
VSCGRGRCCDAGVADTCGVIGQKLLAVTVLSDEPDSHFRKLFLKSPLNSKYIRAPTFKSLQQAAQVVAQRLFSPELYARALSPGDATVRARRGRVGWEKVEERMGSAALYRHKFSKVLYMVAVLQYLCGVTRLTPHTV